MQRVSLAELRHRTDAWASAVRRTPGVSPLCSGPLWQLAAHDFLHPDPPPREHFIVEDSGNWMIFSVRREDGVCFPLESSWMFGSALAGDPAGLVDMLLATPRLLPRPVGLCLGGIRCGGALHGTLRALERHVRRYAEFPATECMVIDLAGGVEPWLARRSRSFRRTLREAGKGGDIEIVTAGEEPPNDLFARILAIQQQTYKWREGTDIFQSPGYVGFYRSLLEGLHRQGDLRLLFARRGDEDLAYIFGGVADGSYRGLQMSYREDMRSLGLGNRLQWENLLRCEAEGITRYDLGMHSPYKERWADRREENTGIFLVV